ncbi:hypothetical protein BH10ACI1_BH10ACI1_13530 [soil metagenome]
MKKIFLHSLIISTVVLLLSTFIFAQRDRTVSDASQMYVISAKAGGVNLIEGKVSITRVNGKSGYLLKGDTVEIGEKVTPGADGKAEILLNPGSYIRLAENSEFEFLTTSLDDLSLKITRGSAMLEVFADRDYSVSVNASGSQFQVIRSGIYRIDVINNGSARLEVWEGKATVGTLEVKSGRVATVSNGQIAIAKFDRGEKDTLETWSKTRARELTKINERLEGKTLRNTLISGYRTNTWDMYNSFGLWIYDASFAGYCFFPFGSGWSSPYGYGYGWNVWNIRLPYYIYYQPQNPTIINPNTDRQRTRTNNPPFETIQNDVGRSPTDSRNPQVDLPIRQPVPIIVVPANNGARTKDN